MYSVCRGSWSARDASRDCTQNFVLIRVPPTSSVELFVGFLKVAPKLFFFFNPHLKIWVASRMPQPRTQAHDQGQEPATKVCALDWIRTQDPSVHRPTLYPLRQQASVHASFWGPPWAFPCCVIVPHGHSTFSRCHRCVESSSQCFYSSLISRLFLSISAWWPPNRTANLIQQSWRFFLSFVY